MRALWCEFIPDWIQNPRCPWLPPGRFQLRVFLSFFILLALCFEAHPACLTPSPLVMCVLWFEATCVGPSSFAVVAPLVRGHSCLVPIPLVMWALWIESDLFWVRHTFVWRALCSEVSPAWLAHPVLATSGLW